jgi:hypothetical protein
MTNSTNSLSSTDSFASDSGDLSDACFGTLVEGGRVLSGQVGRRSALTPIADIPLRRRNGRDVPKGGIAPEQSHRRLGRSRLATTLRFLLVLRRRALANAYALGG